MEKKLHNYRQGDVALIGVKSLPKGLKASKDTVLMKNGSGGHDHSFKGGIFYPKKDGQFIVGYLKSKGTKIYHPEHNPKGDKIVDGIYEVRTQVEITHSGMVQVVD